MRLRQIVLRGSLVRKDSPPANSQIQSCSWLALPRQCSADCALRPGPRRDGLKQSRQPKIFAPLDPQLRLSLEASPRDTMRLLSNESCPIHQSLFCCGRERSLKKRTLDRVFSASKTRIIREDTGNSVLP